MSRNMEDQELVSQIHVKENSKRIWPFAHIPMYAVLGVKPAYIREKGFKSCVYKFKHVFRDDLGNIKGIKKVHGVLLAASNNLFIS